MTVIGKGLLVAAGAVFVGLVGYKIVSKKRPEVIEKAKKSVSNIKKGASEIIKGAKESFHEGYARA